MPGSFPVNGKRAPLASSGCLAPPVFLKFILVFGELVLLNGAGVAVCRWGPVLGTFVSPLNRILQGKCHFPFGFRNVLKKVQKKLLGTIILTVKCVSGNYSTLVRAMMSDGIKQGGNVIDLLKYTPGSLVARGLWRLVGALIKCVGGVGSWGM